MQSEATLIGSERSASLDLPRKYASLTRDIPNIIVFGETGVGKSSVVNMLRDEDADEEAGVSSNANGVTFSNQAYLRMIGGTAFNVFDTVGLNEATTGTVSAADAIQRLYHFMHELRTGLSLLVYVIRAPRITQNTPKNYDIFYRLFCQEKVPIVLVVTGLEEEEDMDKWWIANASEFAQYQMIFSDVACITASKGKLRKGEYVYEEEYEESRGKVKDLILKRYRRNPWVLPMKDWLTSVWIALCNKFARYFKLKPMLIADTLFAALVKYGGVPEADARKMANQSWDSLVHGEGVDGTKRGRSSTFFSSPDLEQEEFEMAKEESIRLQRKTSYTSLPPA